MTTSLQLSNIINLASVRNERNNIRHINCVSKERHEQRREFRRESSERLFLQIVQSSEQDLVGTTISSTALDVSASGLKVHCSQRIPTGCVIDLWVDDNARPGKFFLSSEVRWVTQSEDGDFEIGVELLDGAATDIEEWRERQG